ncbi:nitrate- and nitrite sensing domain-containing protein [Solwaraspora sp. WMMA2056]|uniref:nitrate- and nitrite sensing domain-containing protein n=1 Tax=Solwaraspora sp. WMMA2056 TaxID=3015161 RepID=UPI00259BB70A|nr:nitrate- and nitrite sensing domain-containing protein [Solwaraspora sp. WMMA2056]WJK40704.1 nitrate- and nitrite sensing domain-containing protein [Solwaraspora sp. WMMA2056]
MSERPKTADSFLSRLRRPVGRLNDLPIWSKLGLIMIVPTLATIVVGTNGLIDHLETASNASQARTLSTLAAASGDLVHDLQNERAAAVLLLGTENAELQERYLGVYNALHGEVEQARTPYSQRRAELTDLPVNFRNLLSRIDQNLADLPGVRSQVVNSATADGTFRLTEAARAYEVLLSDLLDIRDSAAQLASDTELSDHMRAAASLARNKEFLSRERVVVLRAFSQDALTPALRTDYISTRAGQSQSRQSFEAAATQDDLEFYNQTVAGPALREADTYGGFIRGQSEESMRDTPFDADAWDAALIGHADLIRTVEQKIDSDVVNEATILRDEVQQQLLVETILLLVVLLLAILFAALVARSMARSLRELRQGALAVAQYGLPQAVARLRDPQVTAQTSPVQLANQIAEPLPVRSKDEFGQVTEAFNAVHLEAVRTAAEQAALRSSVSTMFVNLARRSQILVDRLIGHLDRLERGEEDPDRLSELFQLDHLATRMRRNDENLLVLAGADSTRVQREPAALIDVLRAAQSEVEHYTRIEFGVVDRDIEVAAHAVNDLVHLVAELFDNATAFSPPDSHVMVEARRVGDRAALYVEDRGIGISGDQLRDLNERLANPPMVDVAVSRMMGLVVVARLANRHGVKVELRPATDRGTIADVTLPTAVLIPRALAGRTGPGAFGSGGTEAPALAGHQQFGAPLALEGGGAPGSGLLGGQPSEPPAPVGPPPRPFEPAPINGGATKPATPRPMPAWSDLTGATNGTNGANGANGAEMLNALPTNGQRTDPLPQRRSNDHWTVDGEVTGAAPTSGVPRQIPASPETHGQPSHHPVSGQPYVPPVSAPPPVSVPPVSAPPVRPFSAPPVPQTPAAQQPTGYQQPNAYQQPTGYQQQAPFQRPAHQQPAPPQQPVGPPQSANPPGAAPPAWPPVAADRDAVAPPVPEKLAAALDMTAELPRVARTSGDNSVTAPHPVVTPQKAGPKKFADETMELPIFRELESAWFRTRRPTAEEARAAAAAMIKPSGAGATSTATTQPIAKVDTSRPAPPEATTPTPAPAPTPSGAGAGNSSLPRRPEPVAAASRSTGGGGGGEGRTGSWQTAADDGWRAASAAAEVSVEEKTQAGLPKRVPMAQLVPGGVEKATSSVQRRTPEAVRGLLSAYHRGVQRGRTQPKDDHSTNPGATPGGQQSSQAGKEHEG